MIPRPRHLLAALAVAAVFPTVVCAQISDSLAVERRAAQIASLLGGATPSLDTIFAPSFLAQVSPAQVRAISSQLATLGHIQRVAFAGPVAGAPSGGRFDLDTDKGYAIPMTLVVDASPPNLVSGLLFDAPAKHAGSVDDLLKEFSSLPGHASLFAARVDGSNLVPLAVLDTGRALGIGSSFKLYVLAELVREIESGKRHWADVAHLDSMSRSLPSGFLQTWPVGTPITVQTLATLMISQSDNTGADNLLHLLGRENVEKAQAPAGNTHAARNEPFLSTREMFALKTPASAALLSRYIAGDVATRRAVLVSPGILARQQQMPDFTHGPNAIDSVEWFASTADLARTMIWLRDHSATGEASAAREVLSVNKGIDWPKATWRYAGFKGGSEPGVLSLTFLAQRTDGTWFVLSATWNDSAHEVDETKFVALVSAARDLMAKP